MRVLLFLVLAVSFAPARADSVDYGQCAPDGVAVGGFDVVSYHNDSGPLAGKREHSVARGGFTYLFADAENLARFQADPERYLPRYRGWCAATLAMGRLACPDPTNYKIEDGSLLLFELVGFTNGRTVWDTDPLDFRRRADEHARQLLE